MWGEACQCITGGLKHATLLLRTLQTFLIIKSFPLRNSYHSIACFVSSFPSQFQLPNSFLHNKDSYTSL